MTTVAVKKDIAFESVQEVVERDFETAFTPYRWTPEEYERLGKDGFFEGQRVELIEGEIVRMAPMDSPHAAAVRLANQELLVLVEGLPYFVDVHLPLRFAASEPEPDLAVLRGSPREFAKSHPQSAELVVEVSDSTVRRDKHVKALLYAAAGIQEYWVLNLPKRHLEVFRVPKPDDISPTGFIYDSVHVYGSKEVVSPLFAPERSLKITDVLPEFIS